MTGPALIEVEVPAEQVRVGDLLVIPDENGEPAESPPVGQVILDAVPEFVYAFTPDQHPLRRDSLVRVRRPPTVIPDPPAVDPVEYAAVRDLALALADQVGPKAPAGKSLDTALARTAAAADRVRKGKR